MSGRRGCGGSVVPDEGEVIRVLGRPDVSGIGSSNQKMK